MYDKYPQSREKHLQSEHKPRVNKTRAKGMDNNPNISDIYLISDNTMNLS